MYETRVYRDHPAFSGPKKEQHWSYDILDGKRPVAGGTRFSSEIDAYAACSQHLCKMLEERSLKSPSIEKDSLMVSPWSDRDQRWLSSGGAVGSILIECNEGTGVRYMGARLIGKTGARLYETDFPVPGRGCRQDLPKVAATMADGLITAWYARQDW